MAEKRVELQSIPSGTAGGPAPTRLLHVLPSFGIGGVPLRMTRIINAVGPAFTHTIIALDGATAAAASLDPNLAQAVGLARDPRQGLLARLRSCQAKILEIRPDLLLTYNWGSIEWAMANRLTTRLPHIHHEAGFGREEAERQLKRRIWLRRLALGHAARIVVPSLTLQRIASEIWRVPASKLVYLPNGIDGGRLARDASRHETEPRRIVIGTVAPLRPEKNVARLIEAFAEAVGRLDLELLIAGEGSERHALERRMGVLGVADRVSFLGQLDRPEIAYRRMDVFALSSDTEQMPNAVLEAMAAGLPIASVDVGDVTAMVSPENRPFIVRRGDTGALAEAIVALARDPGLRDRLGEANLRRVRSAFAHETMVARWHALWCEVIPATRLAPQAITAVGAAGHS